MAVPAILGTGTLRRSEPGVMTGEAEFAIRGTFPLILDLLSRDGDQHTARLRVGADQGRVSQFRGDPMSDEPAVFWHGFVPVEGYEMRVRIVPSDGWAVQFLDCVQRDPTKWQVAG